MRLNRYLAASGFGSRRACEQLILDGKVSINGHFIRELATSVGEEDDVRVRGKQALPPKATTVIALHKPKGFLCTKSDEKGRKTVFELLPPPLRRLNYIGRLDLDSEGLLLLTDDGVLAQALTHPSRKVDKEYLVTLDKALPEDAIPKLLKGFHIEGGKARMESVRPVGPRLVKVVLRQGIKRQIREMFFRVGLEVKRLIRTRIANVNLESMRPGEWRPLQKREIASLQPAATIAK